MLISITPNKEKASSILKMVETTLRMIKEIDQTKFPSNVTKEYYEVIRELISVILLLDGYKTQGEGAHKEIIDYLANHYKEFSTHEISFIDELRKIRNRISYDGFFVTLEYIKRNKEQLTSIIAKLKKIINTKL